MHEPASPSSSTRPSPDYHRDYDLPHQEAGGHRSAASSAAQPATAAGRTFSRRHLRLLAVCLLALFALGGALILHSCDDPHPRAALAAKAAPAFRTAPVALRPLPEPRVWLHAAADPLPLSVRAIEPADVRQAIFEALCLLGGSMGIFAAGAWLRHRSIAAR